jgi:hypothetical protein
LNGAYGGFRNLNSLTPTADNDRLTCASGTCTLTISGVEFGLSRNRYFLFVFANGSVNSKMFFISDELNGAHDFTIGDIPSSNQLVSNGSF